MLSYTFFVFVCSYISVFSSSGSVYLQMSERKAYFSGLSFSSCNGVFFLNFFLLFGFWGYWLYCIMISMNGERKKEGG